MYVRDEFTTGLSRYRRLFLMWTGATLLLLLSNYALTLSAGFATLFFVFGALLLATAGVSCAYTIAKENM